MTFATIKWVAIAAAFFGWSFLCYHQGSFAPKLAEAKIEIKQSEVQDAKRVTDQSTVQAEAKAYEDAALAPIAAPIARMCYYTPAAVPSAVAPRPGADAKASTHATDQVSSSPGPDIGPGLMRAAAVAESQVVELQDYIVHVCQGGKL